MGKQLKKQGRTLSIKRPTTPAEHSPEVVPVSTTAPATGGIHLASATTESDPFRKSITDAGYIILEENDYGAVVRLDKGKPTFIPKTSQGFDPSEKTVRNTVILPQHINTAMKVRTARMGVSTTQYLIQLVLADLRKNEDL